MWKEGFNAAADASICGKVTQTLKMQDGTTPPNFARLSYTEATSLGVLSVETGRKEDVGEYLMQIFYESKDYKVGAGGPSAFENFKLVVTELA